MREIELSTMFSGDQLRLDAFEASAYIRTRHQQFTWGEAWNRIMQVGIYQKGPDVSQVGSTWLENLVEMHAIRPFQADELAQFGGREAFSPVAWETGTRGGAETVSIPWVLDTRNLFFRRDMFALAGVDPNAAFESPAGFREALLRLRRSGLSRYPLAMSTGGLLIHNLASWVWAGGGHFRSLDGRKMALLEPEARRGLIEYFKLFEFVDPAVALKGSYDNDLLYYSGGAAVLVGGHWVATNLKTSPKVAHPIVLDTLGQALPPGGVPFIGGSHLVMWRHSLHESANLELIHHLLSPETLVALALSGMGFPALQQVYEHPALAHEPLFAGVIESLKRGRTIRSAYRWAAVEVRLNDFANRLWEDLFSNPSLNVESEVETRLKILCERLEKTLLASW